MNKITLWYRFKKGEWKYNHYEEGWDDLIKPLSEMGSGNRWAKEYAYMESGTVKYIKDAKV